MIRSCLERIRYRQRAGDRGGLYTKFLGVFVWYFIMPRNDLRKQDGVAKVLPYYLHCNPNVHSVERKRRWNLQNVLRESTLWCGCLPCCSGRLMQELNFIFHERLFSSTFLNLRYCYYFVCRVQRVVCTSLYSDGRTSYAIYRHDKSTHLRNTCRRTPAIAQR